MSSSFQSRRPGRTFLFDFGGRIEDGAGEDAVGGVQDEMILPPRFIRKVKSASVKLEPEK